jgi:drug/metabolite transporter (DMT)-like permease
MKRNLKSLSSDLMTEEEKLKGQATGPAIVSIANAARAFDAPVRYPVLFRAPHLGEESLAGTMAFPRMSSFIAMIEHLFGFLILFPILWITRGFTKLKEAVKNFDRRDWFAIFFVSFGGSALGLFFFLISFALGNPTIAILLQKAQPLVTLIFAFFILKERPTKLFWVTLGVALVGIGLITVPDIQSSVQSFDYAGLIAILCSLVAATLWGGSTVFGRILTKKVDFWDLTLLRYLGGFIFLVVFNVVLFTYNGEYFGLLNDRITIFKADWGWQLPIGVCILYFAILTGGVLPLALYYFGLKRTRASIAGLAELAFPLLAIFVNWYFLGWGLDIFQGIGAGILFLAVSVLSYVNAKEMEKNKQNKVQETSESTKEEKE